MRAKGETLARGKTAPEAREWLRERLEAREAERDRYEKNDLRAEGTRTLFERLAFEVREYLSHEALLEQAEPRPSKAEAKAKVEDRQRQPSLPFGKPRRWVFVDEARNIRITVSIEDGSVDPLAPTVRAPAEGPGDT